MSIIKVRCIRCRKACRNDGTEEQPKWVCDNQKCVRYVQPTEGTTTSSDSSTSTIKTPSSGEPVKSDDKSVTDTNDNGNTETESTL